MTIPLRIIIHGTPVPQGSMTGGKFIRHSNGKVLHPWREAVSLAGIKAMEDYGIDEPLDGPLELRCEFRFAMPQSRRKVHKVRRWKWKTTMPDLDKLVRAVGDSLTAGAVITDDARFVKIAAAKTERLDEWTGAEITISKVEY